MSRLWSDLVKQLSPYVPGEQPQVEGLIKLNTNENPYPPSPAVSEVIDQQALDRLRLYPDPDSSALKQSLARRYDLSSDQIFVGNGSDEVLALAFMALFKNQRPLLFPDISYSFYPVYCGLFEIPYQQIPLADDFTIDFSGYPVANGGIIFPNPNAPTGIAQSLPAIAELAEQHRDSVILVDEAYVDFGADSAIELIDAHDNILVVQTLSKSRSLAGLRVGFAFGQPALIEALERVKNSFNSYPIDRLAEQIAIAAIDDQEYFAHCCQRIINTRTATENKLQALGFRLLPSAANFLFVEHKTWPASELFQALRAEKILVRYFDKPRIDNFLRITVGTEEEMAALCTTLARLVA